MVLDAVDIVETAEQSHEISLRKHHSEIFSDFATAPSSGHQSRIVEIPSFFGAGLRCLGVVESQFLLKSALGSEILRLFPQKLSGSGSGEEGEEILRFLMGEREDRDPRATAADASGTDGDERARRVWPARDVEVVTRAVLRNSDTFVRFSHVADFGSFGA